MAATCTYKLSLKVIFYNLLLDIMVNCDDVYYKLSLKVIFYNLLLDMMVNGGDLYLQVKSQGNIL